MSRSGVTRNQSAATITATIAPNGSARRFSNMGDDAWRSALHDAAGTKSGELGIAPKCKRICSGVVWPPNAREPSSRRFPAWTATAEPNHGRRDAPANVGHITISKFIACDLLTIYNDLRFYIEHRIRKNLNQKRNVAIYDSV